MLRRLLLPALLIFSASDAAQTSAPAPNTATKSSAKSTTKTITKKKTKAKPSAAKTVEPTPPVVTQVPAPPPTLAQQPPVPPRVTYQNGSLTIDAPNSTLGDILSAVRRATNASIEGPTNVTDRVAVRIGPAPARDVLNTLLHGSRFDYVLMGTPQQPNSISRVVLIARAGGNEPQSATNASAQPAGVVNAQPRMQAPVANTDNDGEEDEAADRDEQPIQNPPMQPDPVQQRQQQMPPEQNAQEQNQNQNQQQNPNQPKTPEQLYQELQNLERQRAQQNQQGQQPPPQPPQ